MRIAVTGASGFIGTHLVRAARAAGMEVAAVVRSPAAAERVRAAGAVPFKAPLDRLALSDAFSGASAVVHLAHIGSERGGDTYQAINVEGTRQVAAAAWDAGVPRVVMLSGLGVAHYGQSALVTDRYFRSKLDAEAALFASSLQVVVLRPSWVLGAGEAFVPWLVAQARTGRLELPGNGSNRMQPIAVEDAAQVILTAADRATDPARLFHPGRPPHRVIDLVGPEIISVRDFVARLFTAAARLGHPVEFETVSVPVEEALRLAASSGWHGMAADELDCVLCDEVADPGPLEALLGRPLTALDEAIGRAVTAMVFPQ